MKKLVTIMLVVLILVGSVIPAYAAGKTVAVKKVQLNKTSCTTTVNTSVKLSATVSPSNATNKKITWSSSNTKVAKVDKNGVVSAIGVGKATITAKSNNGKTAKCTVTVKAIAVDKVVLNKTSVETVGKTKLIAIVSPANATNKTLKWTTSNKKVATVDQNGLVTPTGYGTATITVKSANGKQATCKVTVKKDVRIQKTYTVAESGPYRMADTVVLIVDGKTGKVVGTDCYQTSRDVTFIIGATCKGKGIKMYNQQSNYADFRANWSVSLTIGLGKKLKLESGDTVTKNNCYRLYTDGTFKVINSSCSDLLGLCKAAK